LSSDENRSARGRCRDRAVVEANETAGRTVRSGADVADRERWVIEPLASCNSDEPADETSVVDVAAIAARYRAARDRIDDGAEIESNQSAGCAARGIRDADIAAGAGQEKLAPYWPSRSCR
jgi:hypothetical protein